MKVLNLDGLAHYNTNLLDKVENMIDDSIKDCVNDISVNESSIMFSKKDGTSKNISLTLGDADTLDGYHADSFAKLNGAQFTGAVTIQSDELNGAYNGLLIGDDCYIGDCNISNTIGLMGKNDNNIAYIKFGKNGQTLGFDGSNFLLTSGETLTGNVLSTVSDTSERHFQVNNSLHNGHLCTSVSGNFGLYSNTHTKWLVKCDTSGNVTLNGTASNSDTLDGYHASSFPKLEYKSNTNWDTIVEAGMYRLDNIEKQSNYINGMTSYGQLLVVRGSSDTIAQIYFNYADNNIFTRSANGVGGSTVNWTAWHRLYSSVNMTYGTNALTPGSSGLSTGSFYFQYE